MLCNRGTKSEEWEADDFRTERDKRPAKAVVSLLQSVQRKTLNYWQLVSVVIHEGEESYTTK